MLIFLVGPVTDFSATVIHWMRKREPLYKGGYTGEAERPSASYIVDVSILFACSDNGLLSLNNNR